jgi:hypothetical protein
MIVGVSVLALLALWFLVYPGKPPLTANFIRYETNDYFGPVVVVGITNLTKGSLVWSPDYWGMGITRTSLTNSYIRSTSGEPLELYVVYGSHSRQLPKTLDLLYHGYSRSLWEKVNDIMNSLLGFTFYHHPKLAIELPPFTSSLKSLESHETN